jgi:hypothetical protein
MAGGERKGSVVTMCRALDPGGAPDIDAQPSAQLGAEQPVRVPPGALTNAPGRQETGQGIADPWSRINGAEVWANAGSIRLTGQTKLRFGGDRQAAR